MAPGDVVGAFGFGADKLGGTPDDQRARFGQDRYAPDEGFTGTASLLYHVYPPTTVKSARRLRETRYEADPDQTLRHRHFRTSQVKRGGSPTLDRVPLLFNNEVAMLYVEPDENDAHFYRNAQSDELVYVSKGTGTLESVFGDLPFHEGDYLIIHRGIMHRWRLDLGGEQAKLLIMESRGRLRWPKRKRNKIAQMIDVAPSSVREIAHGVVNARRGGTHDRGQ